MNLHACKTNRGLWLGLTLILFVLIGFAPLFRYGKGGDESFIRLAPSLLDFFRSGPTISIETIPMMIIVALWIVGAAALGWLMQCAVVVFLSWTREKRKTQH